MSDQPISDFESENKLLCALENFTNHGEIMKHPYTINSRLADVMALIQVLSLDKHSHRSESGLEEELQGSPKSADTWTSVAEDHPEFFRVRGEGTHVVSLVGRNVLPKNDDGTRELSIDLIGKLLDTAIQLHDREMERAHYWKTYIPIIVAVTAGLFTVFGVFLTNWLSNGNCT